MVEVVTKGGIDLRGAREPEPERDLSGSDEHIEVRELLVGELAVLAIALDEGIRNAA